MTIASLSASDAQNTLWDAIVIGSGMGGGTAGLSLAQQGLKVLFCEKGEGFDRQGTLTETYPEELFADTPDTAAKEQILRNSGRYSRTITTNLGPFNRPTAFYPQIGEGVGGSSALYGMVLQRFQSSDMPQTSWPFPAQDLERYYAQAEAIYDVERDGAGTLPLSSSNKEILDYFIQQGLHAERLPLAGGQQPRCLSCQSVLCHRSCKKHAGNMAVERACHDHGAALLTRCSINRIVADGNHINQLLATTADGQSLSIKGRVIILAAGALHSPALLLASADENNPNGLGNRYDQVGRNLMRHYTDIFAIRPHALPEDSVMQKQIGITDFYQEDGITKASLQSFGPLITPKGAIPELADSAKSWGGEVAHKAVMLMSPLLSNLIANLFSNKLLLATIIQDTPQADNRVSLSSGSGKPALHVQYTISASDKQLISRVRQSAMRLLRPYKPRPLLQAENNRRLAHVCGTCRMGHNPATSVVDASNKVHGFDNLFVVDASFFPTSGTINPSLTIAANALRVSERIKSLLA